MISFGILFILTLTTFEHMAYVACSLESPIIALQQGKLKGIEETSTDGRPILSFYGIPYAKPPVGELRFEEPVQHGEWEGLLEANKIVDPCLQAQFLGALKGFFVASGSEDCLYLNVFTPKPLKDNPLLPVMIFIHGGSFISGSSKNYKPNVLLNEDIVLVIIQYRLGVFGFLSTEDETMPGNMGLKDQRLAMQWVRDNIMSFGGDPEKVTIFGESAGGGSVHLHVLSPGSKGLFSGAISQSGTALCPWAVSNQHRNYATEIGQKLGCKLEGDSKNYKKCLQKLDGTALLHEAFKKYKLSTTPIDTAPRVDEDFLPDNPETLISTGRYNKVNMMSGVVRDEGAFFTALMYVNPSVKNKIVEEFSTYAPYSLMIENEPEAANLSKTIFDFYLKGKTVESDPLNELTEMLGDGLIKIGSDIAALLHAQDTDINLYLYELNHRGQRSLLDILGLPLPKYVSHADDLLYLFSGGAYLGWIPLEEKQDIDLRRKMTKLWTNFAKYGNPTPPGSFDFIWTPANSYSFGHLSITTTPTMLGYPREESLRFWTSLKTRQNQRLLSSYRKPPLNLYLD